MSDPEARAHLPAPIHGLVATALAPAAALSDPGGQIRAGGMHGLFVADVRILSEARLSLDGDEPDALRQLAEGPGRTRFIGFARGLGDVEPDPTVRVERTRLVRPDGMDEEIRIRSTAERPVRASVAIDLSCDLTPLEQAKASPDRSSVAGTVHESAPGAGTLIWTADDTTATVVAVGARAAATPDRIAWDVELTPGTDRTLHWGVRCTHRQPVVVSPDPPVEWAVPRVSADEPRLARLLAQSLDDIAALRLAEAADPASTFIAAGVPWFLTFFGRDSLWVARMMLPLGTGLAEGTLRALARRQGTAVNPNSCEQPGKILHELRREDIWLGETAERPVPYYGTVDATPLWISLLAEAWRWGMPEATVAGFLPNLRAALSWLDRYADPDGDGFLKYLDHSGRGLANQGWKDSGSAIRFRDASLAQPPIALCEVQGYAHRAALDAAALLDVLDDAGPRGEADRWREYAAALSERFRKRFWVSGPAGDHPALALDGRGRPVDALTSNIGHLVGTGMLNRAEETRVVELLGTDAMSSGFGLRTMSTLDRGYAPLSYHCGAIWPHDTAIALGGLTAAAIDGIPGADRVGGRLLHGLLDAAEAFEYRLPELYGGDARDEVGRPVPHPGACRPQAWSAAAAVAVLTSALGLAVDLPRRQVWLRPRSDLGRIDVRGLRIAGRPVDVAVDAAGEVRVRGLPAGVLAGDRTDAVELAGH
jgi:glycogen debranching enzyme